MLTKIVIGRTVRMILKRIRRIAAVVALVPSQALRSQAPGQNGNVPLPWQLSGSLVKVRSFRLGFYRAEALNVPNLAQAGDAGKVSTLRKI